MRIKIDIKLENLKINRLIKYFILSDLLFIGGWGLVSPIFSIFIIQKIPGATLITVGTAIAIYWLTKSIAQVPVAVYIDRRAGEKDDFYVLILGLMLGGFSAMLFALVKTIPALFGTIFLQGLAFGLYTPSWSAMFSRHLNREHYALDWSLDSTTIGLASGITSFFGGALASFFDFETVFIFTGILSLASAALLLAVPNLIIPRPRAKEPLIRDHTPADINR